MGGNSHLTIGYELREESQMHVYEGLVTKPWDLRSTLWEANHARVWNVQFSARDTC
jgi:hypothetical protein